jgi:hypothetical protein
MYQHLSTPKLPQFLSIQPIDVSDVWMIYWSAISVHHLQPFRVDQSTSSVVIVFLVAAIS